MGSNSADKKILTKKKKKRQTEKQTSSYTIKRINKCKDRHAIKKRKSKERKIEMYNWNVTPLLLGGSNFYLFTDLNCTRIGLNSRFALPTKEGGKERAFRPIRVQCIGLKRNKNSFPLIRVA